jgi:hypothetical protein
MLAQARGFDLCKKDTSVKVKSMIQIMIDEERLLAYFN